MLMPDQVSFDCPSCEITHQIMRNLDFEEGLDGVWRTKERPGLLCDCGVELLADFTLSAEGSPATPDIRSRSDAEPPGGS